jgi:zinc-binding alcohol dehydrogenase/oxidoreductase
MLAFVEKHRIRPVIDSQFQFEQYYEAFKRMDEGKQFGKVVLLIP